MKKVIVLFLSVVMIASTFAGMMTASAAGAYPVLLLEREDLLPSGHRHTGYHSCIGTVDDATGIVRLETTGEDPYYGLLPRNTVAAPVMAIRYRTNAFGGRCKFYASSRNAIGEGSTLRKTYVADEEWNLMLVDFSAELPAGQYDRSTNVFEHLRYDFFESCFLGDWIEIEYIAFFHNAFDARTYDEQRPLIVEEEPPVVTETVAATETETKTEAETETEAVTTEIVTETEPAVDTEADTTADTVVDSVVDTTKAEETTATQPEAGCKAVIASASALAVVVAAGVVICKKKDSFQ